MAQRHLGEPQRSWIALLWGTAQSLFRIVGSSKATEAQLSVGVWLSQTEKVPQQTFSGYLKSCQALECAQPELG